MKGMQGSVFVVAVYTIGIGASCPLQILGLWGAVR